ncbi:MAG: hypothetical protein QXV83_00450 [Candidatus Anstonellaceae archaeon]
MKKLKIFSHTFPQTMKEFATEMIDQLITYAIEISEKEPQYAKKYIALAKKIAMRHKIPIGSKRKQLFCKKCNSPYVSKNLRIEKKGEFVEILCPVCNFKYRVHNSKLIEKYKKRLKLK